MSASGFDDYSDMFKSTRKDLHVEDKGSNDTYKTVKQLRDGSRFS